MGNVFRVRPVRVKRANGQVLTPDMEITVTTQSYTSDPFYNGAKEVQEQYMRVCISSTTRRATVANTISSL